jgi:aryl-alcohol dehydrogenase-like predicted oxidoreductase
MISAADSGTWTLGDLTVHRMGFGAMRLPQVGTALRARVASADRQRAIAVLRKAVELGVNHLDTAAYYFSPLRSANELINSALSPYPQDLVITTKVGPGRDPSGDFLPLARPDQLRGQVEENLRQLGRDHLDVVNLRIFGVRSIAEHFGALADLRREGLIRHLGLSTVDEDQLREALAIAPVVCVQNPYGIGFRRKHDALVDLCGELGIAFVPFFAIAADGKESGAREGDHESVRTVAERLGASPAQVRLAWTLHRGEHVLAIPGTSNPDHLAENVAAGALRLSPEDVNLLSSEMSGM